jgi:hypothetical protein
MRHIHSFEPANDISTRAAPQLDFPPRRRSEWLSSALFAGGSIAAFLILLACVFAATVLYYRWH